MALRAARGWAARAGRAWAPACAATAAPRYWPGLVATHSMLNPIGCHVKNGNYFVSTTWSFLAQ